MKCPKCSYVSHDYLNACRKCSVDLLGFKAQMQLHVVQSGNIDLRSVLGGMQSSPMTSGEFSLGEALFKSPMLVDAQAEDGFDINLDDDFSFTPSPMSLESHDGFEVARPKSTTPESPRPAATDRPRIDLPDTGYATVIMDVSGMDDERPPLKPAGDMFDAPLELAGPKPEVPIESAEVTFEPLELTAELSSSAGRTSDLDLTSMELNRTTRDIEILKQLQNKALSEEAILPGFDEATSEEVDWSSSDASEPIMDDLDYSDLEKIAVDATAEATSSTGSASGDSETSFTMPDLPDLDADERPINAFTEAFSFDIDPLAPPEPLPVDFPALQTSTFPRMAPEEVTLVDEAWVSETTPPVTEDDATGSPDSNDATIDLDVGDVQPLEAPVLPDLPENTDAFLIPSPDAATLVDEPSPFAFTGHTTADFTLAPPNTRDTRINPGIGDTQSPEPPDDPLVFPDLPADTDALLTQSPEEATLVDAPSPFAPTGRIPVDLSSTPPKTIQTDAGEPDASEIDDELDLELLHPDEQPPKKRD